MTLSFEQQKAAIEALPPLSQTLKIHQFGGMKKSLGQNFLFDLQLIDRIVNNAGDLSDHVVIEIGPGPGGLSRMILRRNVAKLIVIEKDQSVLPVLQELKVIAGSRMEIVSDDAMKMDWPALLAEHNPDGKPVKVIANLPYNVGSPLLFSWLEHRELFTSFTLMFQKEVVDRITAAPNCKDYGRMSVMCQILAECVEVMQVDPANFTPPPKVMSAVVHVKLRDAVPKKPLLNKLEFVLQAAFNQRRKTLGASLKKAIPNARDTLQQAGIDPMRRPENLTVEEFVNLAEHLL